MPHNPQTNLPAISLRPVSAENWRAVARLTVSEPQREFVAEPAYYLALCCYGQDWQPLAIYLADEVIGFMMWAADPADGACWLGGILIDRHLQGRGYGRQAVRAALDLLHREHGFTSFALSYQPANRAARHLYQQLGFVETGEWEDDEIVARRSLEV